MRARIAVVVLLAVVVFTAGCSGGGGKKGSGNGGGSLTFWTAEDNPERVKATQAIIDRFEQQSGIKVRLVAVAEDQLQSQITSASAAGSLPDVLGRQTFSKRGLSLVQANGQPVAIPSDSWTQLLVYRKDLFHQAGLAVPTTFAAIQTAAAILNGEGMAGIVAATKPGNLFTQQTFEYFALANNCQLTDQRGHVTLTSKACVDTFKFYIDLIHKASVMAEQDADTTRAAYLEGRAAMVIWSSFILDELAGLRNDVAPSCPQCGGDRSFLARNSGVVTAIKGPDGTEPSQFGEVTAFAITKGANHDAAKRFVEFMMSDGYVDWLSLAPEGKFPIRTGTIDQPGKFTAAWNQLRTGVDRREPLSEVYPPDVLDVLRASTGTMNRWGFPQGQGRLAGAQLEALPIPKALAAALHGRLDAATAADQAQADMERIARSIK